MLLVYLLHSSVFLSVCLQRAGGHSARLLSLLQLAGAAVAPTVLLSILIAHPGGTARWWYCVATAICDLFAACAVTGALEGLSAKAALIRQNQRECARGNGYGGTLSNQIQMRRILCGGGGFSSARESIGGGMAGGAAGIMLCASCANKGRAGQVGEFCNVSLV